MYIIGYRDLTHLSQKKVNVEYFIRLHGLFLHSLGLARGYKVHEWNHRKGCFPLIGWSVTDALFLLAWLGF